MRPRGNNVLHPCVAMLCLLAGCGGSGGAGTLPTPPANLSPTITSSPITAATASVAYEYNLTASDDGPLSQIAFEALQLPSWLTLADNGNGSATLSGTPTANDAGPAAVSIRVVDGGSPARSATQSFDIIVSGIAREFRDEIIYWAMTDRFANGDPLNDNGNLQRAGDLAQPANPRGWHGGDFAGLRERVEAGYFSDLGFSALWISPVVYQVPAIDNGAFAGFHGYWAEDFQRIEPHFGTLDELRALADALHARDMRLIVDVVVNHAGYGAGLVSAQPDWFRTGNECGNDDVTQCLAGLPDFIQENAPAKQFLDDSVNWLIMESGLDGLRMDTMKHVPDAYWQSFFAPGGVGDPARVWTVGEVFSGSVSQLARYLDTLDSPSVFDFALYFAITDSLARGASVARLADVFALDGQYGDPTRLSTFVDNHDVRRFVTASTDAGFSLTAARRRLDLALSLIYTARGIPVVYYGSEIGMQGGDDPDNRRDMDFTALASSTLDERLAALGEARSAYPALRRGRQIPLWPTAVDACLEPETGLDDAAAFGQPVYVRGSFEGWQSPPADRQRLRNLGGSSYRARINIAAGTHEYKIASDDYSIERAVVGTDTLLDTPQSLTVPQAGSAGNGRIDLAVSGCYAWTVVVQNSSSELTISRLGESADILAFARTLDAEESVIVVLSNAESAVDLADLPGGGLPVAGLFADGSAVTEITGQPHDFSVAGGLMRGTLAPATLYAITAR